MYSMYFMFAPHGDPSMAFRPREVIRDSQEIHHLVHVRLRHEPTQIGSWQALLSSRWHLRMDGTEE